MPFLGLTKSIVPEILGANKDETCHSFKTVNVNSGFIFFISCQCNDRLLLHIRCHVTMNAICIPYVCIGIYCMHEQVNMNLFEERVIWNDLKSLS